MIVTGSGGEIVQVNPRATELFGYSRDELLGQPVEMLMPGRLREAHGVHRRGYESAPRMRAMGVGLHLVGRRRGGSEFPVDIMLSPATVGGSRVFSPIDMSAMREECGQFPIFKGRIPATRFALGEPGRESRKSRHLRSRRRSMGSRLEIDRRLPGSEHTEELGIFDRHLAIYCPFRLIPNSEISK